MDRWKKLYDSQCFDPGRLDYTLVERHTGMLEQLSATGNSASFIFDLNRREYIYASQNFNEILGIDLRKLVSDDGQEVTDTMLHPDDNALFEQMQLNLYTFLFSLPVSEKRDYKHIYTFRVLNRYNEYVRLVSQQQVLELDDRGNIWLVMGIIDLSPEQNPGQGFESSILNYRTGKRLAVSDLADDAVKLSKREKEVLQLVKDGLLSKEISDVLQVSVNTINNHRQNILRKTNTDNAIEAIRFAEKMGLL